MFSPFPVGKVVLRFTTISPGTCRGTLPQCLLYVLFVCSISDVDVTFLQFAKSISFGVICN